MSVYDVTLWGDMPANPNGVPADWPAQLNTRPDDAPPPAPPVLRMTQAELDAYMAEHQAEYDAWQAEQQRRALIPTPVDAYFACVVLAQTPSKSGVTGRTLYDDAKAASAQVGGLAQLAFDRASRWGRWDQMVVDLAHGIGLSDEEIDSLFYSANDAWQSAQAT